MRLFSHLAKSRLGIYYLRLYVPKSLQPIFGTAEIRRSLATRDPRTARDLAHVLSPHVRRLWRDMKHNKDPWSGDFPPYSSKLDEILGHVKRVKYQFPDGTLFEAEGDSPQEVADFIATSAPHLLDGVAAAMKPFVSAAPASSAERPPLARTGRKKAPTYRDLIEPAFIAKSIEYKGRRTEQDMRQKAEAFAEFVGDIPIAEITVHDFIHFKADLIKKGAAAQTINKYVNGVNVVFKHAIGCRLYAGESPTAHQRAKVSKRSSRESFRPPHLATIFNPARLATIKNPAEFWFPLIMLHTGMRPSELGQIQLMDIYQQDGVWVIDINRIEDSSSLKTAAATRVIPIPQGLIELGILDYVDDVKSLGAKRLFPWFTETKQGYAASVGKTFNRRLTALDLKTVALTFYSFRRTANNKLTRGSVEEGRRAAMLGQEHETINATTYDGAVTFETLVEHVSPLLRFDELDYPALRMQKGRFLPFLRNPPKPRKKREKVADPAKVKTPQAFKPRGKRKPTA